MKYVSIFLSCLAIGPLVAETVGNIEYSIPQNWVVGKETIDRIYKPIRAPTTADEVQLFSVSSSNVFIGTIDQASLQAMLQRQFPTQTVVVNILETAPNDVIFEWSLTNESTATYAWSRIIFSAKGYTWLSGFSGSSSNIDMKRSSWVSLLKEANTVQN